MQIILLLVFGTINLLIADRKGYSKILWFLAAGFLGLIILIFLPNTNDPKYDSEQSAALVRKGNTIAGVIVVVALAIGLLFILASL